jgi:hypothetical protein
MKTGEGACILENRLALYRAQSREELTKLLLAPVAEDVVGPSGKRYQVIVQASWTGSPGGDLRVVAGVDDRGWQLFNPLTDSFVSQPAAAREGA